MKATGGNHFQYSDEHVSYLLITGDGVAIIEYRCHLGLSGQEYSDGVGPSPKGGAGAGSPPSKSATESFVDATSSES